MNEVSIDSQGRVQLPDGVVSGLKGRSLQVVPMGGQGVFLCAAQPGEELAFSGQLGQVCVTDLLSFINMFRKNGVLRFSLVGGTKEIFFEQGEVVSALSTFAEEDFGEVLCELGKLSREQLQEAGLREAKPGTLARVLAERGMVSPKDLWHAARYQVETIVFNLFSHHRGSFCFIHAPARKPAEVKLSMCTQNLIMEGLRRVDEKALFMRRIGSLDAVPSLRQQPRQGLSSMQQGMVEAIAEAPRTVAELVRQLGFGEFEGLRCLYQLVEMGLVDVGKSRILAVAGSFGAVLDAYNEALCELYRKVRETVPAFHQDVEMFLRDLPQPYSYVFRGVFLREDGGVDGARVLANLEGLEEEDKEKLLSDALNELVYMESLTARQCMDGEAFAALISRVHMATGRAKKNLRRNA